MNWLSRKTLPPLLMGLNKCLWVNDALKAFATAILSCWTRRKRAGQSEVMMPPNFDQEGIDAYLDLKGQCAVVTHAWEQLSHHRAHGAQEKADARFQECSENPEEVYATALELLKDYRALCSDLGVPKKEIQSCLFLRLPHGVLDQLAAPSK